MATKKTTKNEKDYSCKFCYFNTCKKTDYNRHISTQKHTINVLATNSNEITTKYDCENCYKKFSDRSGLWRHKKICNENNGSVEDNNYNNKDLIMMLLTQNAQLIEQNAELVKNGTHNTTHNTTNNNSHNKTFNLQFFLNETCKDAMNITDFVETIKIQLKDLIKVGEIGYVEGISNIITTNLQALDITQRPIHCIDKKREVLYVKDDNTWEKENDEKTKVRKLIKSIANKNIKVLPEFKEKYPDCKESDSKYSEQYNKLIIESMGGPGNNDDEKESKIIKNISNLVVVDK